MWKSEDNSVYIFNFKMGDVSAEEFFCFNCLGFIQFLTYKNFVLAKFEKSPKFHCQHLILCLPSPSQSPTDLSIRSSVIASGSIRLLLQLCYVPGCPNGKCLLFCFLVVHFYSFCLFFHSFISRCFNLYF